jgi:hypothetical protein
MIEVMRQQTYPGGDVVIEQTLSAGANYDRYVASYLSEGLKIYALLTVPRGERPEAGGPSSSSTTATSRRSSTAPPSGTSPTSTASPATGTSS